MSFVNANIVSHLAKSGQLKTLPKVLSHQNNITSQQRFDSVVDGIIQERTGVHETFKLPQVKIVDREPEYDVSHSGNLNQEIGDPVEELPRDVVQHSGVAATRGIPEITHVIYITKGTIRTLLYILVLGILAVLFIKLWQNERKITELMLQLNNPN